MFEKLLNNKTPEKNPKILSAILIPITTNELQDLELLFLLWQIWNILSERKIVKNLVISIDSAYNKSIEDRIILLYKKYKICDIFQHLKIIFCDISDSENIYIRNNNTKTDSIPPLGYASGPNTQFFLTMKELSDNHYVLLNETDCVPCKPNWINDIATNVFWSEPFWIKGSSYKGYQSIRSDINCHINGNAIYASGSNYFQLFLDIWKEGLQNEIKKFPFIAYDACLEQLKVNAIKNRNSHECTFFRQFASKFCYTDLINNTSGINDFPRKNDYSSLSTISNRACLVHGKSFIPYSFDKALKHFSNTNLFIDIEVLDNIRNFISSNSDFFSKRNELKEAIESNLQNLCKIFSTNNKNSNNNLCKNHYFVRLNRRQKNFSENNLIFLLGLPRSGTTLLQKLLSTSYNIATCGEPWIQLYFLGSLSNSLSNSKFDSALMTNAIRQAEEESNCTGLLNSIIKEAALDFYWAILENEKKNAKYFLDKTPRYAMIAQELISFFPQSKFIILKRNPFDIACSMISTWTKNVDTFMNSKALKFDLEIGLKRLVHIIKSPPKNYLIFSYKHVVLNPLDIFEQTAGLLNLSANEFNQNYGISTKKFKYGDNKTVDKYSTPVINSDSWRSAFNDRKEGYERLKKYIESVLTHEELDVMEYDAHQW